MNKWGLTGLATFLAAFLTLGLCQRLFSYDRNASLVPYIVFHLSAVVCGIVAAVRGSKWWLLISLFGAALAIQAFIGLIIE